MPQLTRGVLGGVPKPGREPGGDGDQTVQVARRAYRIGVRDRGNTAERQTQDDNLGDSMRVNRSRIGGLLLRPLNARRQEPACAHHQAPRARANRAAPALSNDEISRLVRRAKKTNATRRWHPNPAVYFGEPSPIADTDRRFLGCPVVRPLEATSIARMAWETWRL